MTPGLEQYCKKGRPGLVQIEYVYLKDVDPDSLLTIVNDQYLRPHDVLLLDGDWQTLPTLDRKPWQESQNRTEQGSRFETTLQVQTPQLSAGASRVFDQLSRRKLLVRITDAENRKWVAGNLEQGFRLTYRRDGGGNGGFAGYNVSLVCETSQSIAQLLPA